LGRCPGRCRGRGQRDQGCECPTPKPRSRKVAAHSTDPHFKVPWPGNFVRLAGYGHQLAAVQQLGPARTPLGCSRLQGLPGSGEPMRPRQMSTVLFCPAVVAKEQRSSNQQDDRSHSSKAKDAAAIPSRTSPPVQTRRADGQRLVLSIPASLPCKFAILRLASLAGGPFFGASCGSDALQFPSQVLWPRTLRPTHSSHHRRATRHSSAFRVKGKEVANSTHAHHRDVSNVAHCFIGH
jgi:hypothetical protein